MAKTYISDSMEGFSRSTRHGVSLIASEIRIARKTRKMTQADLARRVGCSRDTIIAIEAAKPSVATAYVLEAAVILGIRLFDDPDDLSNRLQRNRALLKLMPERTRDSKPEFRDDF